MLILVMIAIGGITRLTRSGLSIVEWRPVSGIVPPLTEDAWQAQFELYQKSPEFLQVNSHFGIEDYKNIFIWEYLHRLLGRIIFLFALIPGLILWRRKKVALRLVLLLSGLVAFQGLIGWLMVKSGLNHAPHVSPFMLALHFFSALTVALVAHFHASKMRAPLLVDLSESQKLLMRTFGVILLLQIFYGCLTSGWKAGFAFNTYPLMGGDFFPPGGWMQEPGWVNLFSNPATVQWVHRWLAFAVLFLAGLGARSFLKTPHWAQMRGPLIHLLAVIGAQISLGIFNIIFAVPTWLAVAHQLMASVLVITYFGIYVRLRLG